METLLDKSHRASKVRYVVLTWLCFLNLISYLDRTAISVAAPQVLKEFHPTKTPMGIVFAAFFYLYGLFQIPEGVLKAEAQGPSRPRSKRGYRNPTSSSTLIMRRRVLYGRIW
jgi:sugar phosphate permease